MEKLTELRRRFLHKRCKVITVNEPLYHGSPIDGLLEIRHCREIRPQGHGELTFDAFCVSPNDNMLKCFGDDDGITGLAFNPTPLRCLQLDWFHHYLVTDSAVSTSEKWETKAMDEEIAERLGYWDLSRHEMVLQPDDFLDLIGPEIDGIIFPWQTYERFPVTEPRLYWPHWNTEAEVALLEPGCRKLWKNIDQIVVLGEWFEPEAGWKKVRREMRKRASQEENRHAMVA